MRGAVGADLTLFKNAAKEIKSILKAEGVAKMPLGVDVVEPPMLFALQKRRHRGARRPAGDAAGARSEEHRRADAAQHGGGDGRRRLHRTSPRRSSPASRNRRSSRSPPSASTRWAPTASRRSTRSPASAASPHPHNFTDRLIRPGDQAFFDIIQSFMGYRTCYYRTFNVGRATGRSAPPTRRRASGWTRRSSC